MPLARTCLHECDFIDVDGVPRIRRDYATIVRRQQPIVVGGGPQNEIHSRRYPFQELLGQCGSAVRPLPNFNGIRVTEPGIYVATASLRGIDGENCGPDVMVRAGIRINMRDPGDNPETVAGDEKSRVSCRPESYNVTTRPMRLPAGRLIEVYYTIVRNDANREPTEIPPSGYNYLSVTYHGCGCY